MVPIWSNRVCARVGIVADHVAIHQTGMAGHRTNDPVGTDADVGAGECPSNGLGGTVTVCLACTLGLVNRGH